MRIARVLLAVSVVLLLVLLAISPAIATPSEGFSKKDGDVFDEWGVCRTRAYGADGFFQISEEGFRPVIALESLGENTDIAYELGRQFSHDYADRYQRAEVIFRFVRDMVQYTPDIDQFHTEEFAQNADEMSAAIQRDKVCRGDCEDMAVLLAVMYKGAGYRSAVVLAPSHTAALVYLPDYKRAGASLELGGEPGWVWCEATGRNNNLGWIPKRYTGVRLAAYEVSQETIRVPSRPSEPKTVVVETESGMPIRLSPFMSVIAFMWFLSLLRRRRRRVN